MFHTDIDLDDFWEKPILNKTPNNPNEMRKYGGNIVNILLSVHTEEIKLIETQKEYIDIVDSYYEEERRPFSWNNGFNNSSEKDFELYFELVKHSLYSDNSYLLRKWGIEYPRCDGINTAMETIDYRESLNDCYNEPWEYNFDNDSRKYFKILYDEI
jgi:hypothetical protein